MGKHSAPRRRRVTTDQAYVAMVRRMIRGLEKRAVENPAILPETILAAQELKDVPNVAIARCAVRYSNDPRSAPSAAEIGRLLDVEKQAVSARRKLGDRVLFERQFGEPTVTQAERRARTIAANRAAAERAEQALSTWLARRDELTGSAS